MSAPAGTGAAEHLDERDDKRQQPHRRAAQLSPNRVHIRNVVGHWAP
jgi:hypothetical protein